MTDFQLRKTYLIVAFWGWILAATGQTLMAMIYRGDVGLSDLKFGVFGLIGAIWERFCYQKWTEADPENWFYNFVEDQSRLRCKIGLALSLILGFVGVLMILSFVQMYFFRGV